MLQWVTATVNCYPIIQNLTAIRGTGIFNCNVAAVQDLNWKSFFRMECCQNFDERGEKFLGTLSFWTHCKGSVIFKSRGHGKHSGACTPLEFVKSHHLMKCEHNEHSVCTMACNRFSTKAFIQAAEEMICVIWLLISL